MHADARGALEHEHAVLPYRSPAEFADAALAYLEAGADGDPVYVAARPQSLDALMSALSHAGRSATFADLTLAGTDPGRMLGAIRQFAEGHPGRRVHCIQEWAWAGRPVAEVREAVRAEALIDLALMRSPARVLCGYEADLGPGLLADAECTHPVVLREGKRVPSASYRDDAATRWEEGDPLPAAPQDAAMLRFRDDQAAVRSLTAGQARSAGLAADGVTDLLIAVGELAANTLSHTSGQGTLTVWSTPAEVICEVRDSGCIADPLAGTLRPDPESGLRGRGLWVVHQVSDLVETRSSAKAGTTTRVHMSLSPRRQGRGPAAAPLPLDGQAESSGAGWTVLTLPAEVTMTNSGVVSRTLNGAAYEQARVIADMTATTYIDSSAVAVLMRAHRAFAAAGAELRVVVASRLILRVLELTGAATKLRIFPSRERAEEARTPV